MSAKSTTFTGEPGASELLVMSPDDFEASLAPSNPVERWMAGFTADFEELQPSEPTEDDLGPPQVEERDYDCLVSSNSKSSFHCASQRMVNGWQYYFHAHHDEYPTLHNAINAKWKDEQIPWMEDETRMVISTKETFQLHEWIQSAKEDRILDETMENYMKLYLPRDAHMVGTIIVRRGQEEFTVMFDGRFPDDTTDTRASSTTEVVTKDVSLPDLDVQSSADPYFRSLLTGESDPENVNGGNRGLNWTIHPYARVVGTTEWDGDLAKPVGLELHKLLKPSDFARPNPPDQDKKTHDEGSV